MTLERLKTAPRSAAAPFRLDNLSIYPDKCTLSGPFGDRQLEPKVMALLLYFSHQPNRVLSRHELLDNVWSGVVVCDQVLTRCVSELRKALGKRSGAPKPFIQTLPKKGYCLTCEPVPLASGIEPKLQLPRLPKTDTDTLAVLPLRLLTLKQTEWDLGVGFSRDLTQQLSLIPGLSVAASSSTEHACRESAAPTEIAQAMGARYVVCGTIEHRDKSFRLRIELIEVATKRQLWAHRYDEQINRLFDVQDQLVEQIGRSLSAALELGKIDQIRSREAFNLNVYERMQLAEDARRNYNRETACFIVDNLQAALAEQPEIGVAHALLAMQLSQNLVSGWCDDAQQTSQAAAQHLQNAIRLAPNDSRVLMAAGIAALMRGNHREAMLQLQRSLEKNPNEAHALAEYAMTRFYVTRELEPCIDLIEKAEQAAPQHPRYSIWAYRRGICYYEAGRYAEAIEAYDESIARTPNYHHTYLTKAVSLLATDARSEAAEAVALSVNYAPGLKCADYLAGVQAFGLSVSEGQRLAFCELWLQVTPNRRRSLPGSNLPLSASY